MVFSSYVFLFWFLPLFLLLYYALARAPQRTRNFLLAVAGYIFYGWTNPQFLALMAATTLVDWAAGLVIARGHWQFWRDTRQPLTILAPGKRSRAQRAALALSLVSNLSVLGFFKYFDFASGNYHSFLRAVGLASPSWDGALHLALPLGLSFYTLQALSYTIDVYRGDAKAMGGLVDFACFISMFPHLVAGPILKFSFLAPQLEHRTLTLEKFARGSAFFALGLAKKVLLANPCGKVADVSFGAASLTTLDAWYGAVCYAFQIYFDFSGYSDMAIGLGLMLGFVFAKNFDAPYRSQSITEFWRRWHISLSSWLRDYVYIPLGGSRRGAKRTYANLMLTMLLGGLWHGAAWNFVLWGGYHGALLALERCGRKPRAAPAPLVPLRVAVTFLLVVLGWVLFRSEDLPSAARYFAALGGWATPAPQASLLGGLLYQPYYLICAALAAAAVWLGPKSWEWTQNLTWPKAVLCVTLFYLSLAALVTQDYNPFIYFRF